MSKENRLLILWIIFGFILVTAIDAVLTSLTYAISFTSVKLGLSLSTLSIAIPVITVVLYGLTTYLVLRKIKTDSAIKGIYLTEFPRKTFAIAAFTAIILNGVTNKFNGLAFENTTELNSSLDALTLYGNVESGLWISKWIIVVVLAWTYLKNINN